MASPLQVVIVLLTLCFVSGMFGWCLRDAKGSRIRRFKVKRVKKARKLYKLPKCYNWQGKIY